MQAMSYPSQELLQVEKQVDLVIVTYNSATVIGRCLESAGRLANVIVCDNASDDETAEIARRYGAQVVRNVINVGYGSACNVGAAAGTAPFLLFANPDVQFQPGAVEELVTAAQRYTDAAFNPVIFSKGRRRFKRRSRLLRREEAWNQPAPREDCVVPILHGSCMLVRRSHFERIGGFDPHIFLFHEDDDISVRLRQSGVELRVAVASIIKHSEGGSSVRSALSGRIKGEAMGRSLVYVMKKHQMPLDLRRERRRIWLKLLSPHAFLNGARRAKLLGFLRGLSSEPSGN